ncbi:MAG: LacI family DNA-binding transcriptional regulator [Roseovarius sp.]|nr:LacI family DNA-binding transcriptional regulator [Roseovarius sp.]
MKATDHSALERARPRHRVTMAEVGRIAGVTQVTVSRALSDPSKVSSATLERIRHAIEATGFVPNALAGALASQRSMLVSALVPSLTNVVYSAMLASFGRAMRADGYQLLVTETGFDPEEEAEAVETHLSRRPDALLLTGVHHAPRTRRMLLAAGVPVVELWDMTETPIDICVGFSHRRAGEAMADFALGKGHRRAAVATAADERARRRASAFAARFITGGGAGPVPEAVAERASIETGRDLLADLLDNRGFAGGVVACSSDVLAHGVMIEAQARGLNVPGQVAVIGFGDQEFARATHPALSTVKVDLDRLGREGAAALTARLTGQTPAPSEHVIDLGFEIVDRATA